MIFYYSREWRRGEKNGQTEDNITIELESREKYRDFILHCRDEYYAERLDFVALEYSSPNSPFSPIGYLVSPPPKNRARGRYAYAIAREITDGVYDIISRHYTRETAEKAHRRRNPWVYNDDWAQRHGMLGCGTFEHIYDLDERGEIV